MGNINTGMLARRVLALDLSVNHISSLAHGWFAAFPLLRQVHLSLNARSYTSTSCVRISSVLMLLCVSSLLILLYVAVYLASYVSVYLARYTRIYLASSYSYVYTWTCRS